MSMGQAEGKGKAQVEVEEEGAQVIQSSARQMMMKEVYW
jgi:hypothetical protein